MTCVFVATEDRVSEAVTTRLIKETKMRNYEAIPIGRKGNQFLKQKLASLAHTAGKFPVCFVTDLDATPCAPGLINAWTRDIMLPDRFLFRVAVREIEAWLLADRDGFAEFSGVPMAKLPSDVEALDDPKDTLLRLVRAYGTPSLKRDLLPPKNAKARVGLGYNARLTAFAEDQWNPETAAECADSLARARVRIQALAQKLQQRD